MDESFWMTSNRDGSCHECEDTFNKGDRIVWDPVKFKCYCKNCGAEMIGDDEKETAKEAKEFAKQRYQRGSQTPNKAKKKVRGS